MLYLCVCIMYEVVLYAKGELHICTCWFWCKISMFIFKGECCYWCSFEEQLKHPIRNFIWGELPRLLHIQVTYYHPHSLLLVSDFMSRDKFIFLGDWQLLKQTHDIEAWVDVTSISLWCLNSCLMNPIYTTRFW